jgi:hypothetical protein
MYTIARPALPRWATIYFALRAAYNRTISILKLIIRVEEHVKPSVIRG